MEDDKLSINNLMEAAMAFSMANMFAESMARVHKATMNAIDATGAQEPPRYVYAIINGSQQGPFSLGEIRGLIDQGSITKDTYIWKSGMPQWKRAAEIEEIRPGFGQTPPPFPADNDIQP